MSVTFSLTAEEHAALEARAKAQGVSIDTLFRKAVQHAISSGKGGNTLPDAAGLDRAFEEMADLIPEGASALSDQALRRESVYTREDEWNRNRG
jgi:hypothetical protein